MKPACSADAFLDWMLRFCFWGSGFASWVTAGWWSFTLDCSLALEGIWTSDWLLPWALLALISSTLSKDLWSRSLRFCRQTSCWSPQEPQWNSKNLTGCRKKQQSAPFSSRYQDSVLCKQFIFAHAQEVFPQMQQAVLYIISFRSKWSSLPVSVWFLSTSVLSGNNTESVPWTTDHWQLLRSKQKPLTLHILQWKFFRSL